MTLDELLDTWRTQEQAPLYRVDGERIQQALHGEHEQRRRQWLFEARFLYLASAGVFAGLALVLLLMIYDDDPRSWWDFVIVILGLCAGGIAGGQLYVVRRRHSLRVRRFGASLRDEIGRHLALLDYELFRTSWSGVLNVLMLMLCALALYLAIWRINNEPFNWASHFAPLAGLAWGVWLVVWASRKAAEQARQQVLPRKRHLEELLAKLDQA